MSNVLWRRVAGFVAIGGLGFAIEAGIIMLATSPKFDVPALVARLFSFPCAVLVTWWLNRQYNFRSRNSALAEGGRYLVTQGVGAFVNLATFASCVYMFPSLTLWPVLALAVGAGAGLVANFTLSYLYVFRKRRN